MKKILLTIIILITILTIKVSANVEELELNQEVIIEDESLLAQLKEKLSIKTHITVEDLLKLKDLSLENVRSLNGLEYASNLSKLEITNSELDLDTVGELNSLEILIVLNSKVQFSNISQEINLDTLVIDNCSLIDISFLHAFANLEELSLSNNYISDTLPLIYLSNLERLDLSNNYITSLLDILTLNDMGAFSTTNAAINLDMNYLDTGPNSFNSFYFDSLREKGIEISYDEQNTIREVSQVVIDKEGILYEMPLKEYMHAKACDRFIYDASDKLLEVKYIMDINDYYNYDDYIKIKEELGGHVYKSIGFLNENGGATVIDSVPFEFE